MVGQIFGKLVVKNELINYKGYNKKYYECECVCKRTYIVRKDRLSSGQATQCTDCSRPKSKYEIIISSVYGKWAILKESERRDKWGAKYYECKCECGYIGQVRPDHLLKGQSRECYACNKRGAKHGYARTATYRIWQGIFQRCYNPKSASYYLYGGRGIKVCDRWHQFENFLHDMGIRPEQTYLDRIDPDRDYDPNNCCWATPQESIENRRISKKFANKYAYVKRSDLCDPCLKQFCTPSLKMK